VEVEQSKRSGTKKSSLNKTGSVEIPGDQTEPDQTRELTPKRVIRNDRTQDAVSHVKSSSMGSKMLRSSKGNWKQFHKTQNMVNPSKLLQNKVETESGK